MIYGSVLSIRRRRTSEGVQSDLDIAQDHIGKLRLTQVYVYGHCNHFNLQAKSVQLNALACKAFASRPTRSGYFEHDLRYFFITHRRRTLALIECGYLDFWRESLAFYCPLCARSLPLSSTVCEAYWKWSCDHEATNSLSSCHDNLCGSLPNHFDSFLFDLRLESYLNCSCSHNGRFLLGDNLDEPFCDAPHPSKSKTARANRYLRKSMDYDFLRLPPMCMDTFLHNQTYFYSRIYRKRFDGCSKRANVWRVDDNEYNSKFHLNTPRLPHTLHIPQTQQ